MILYCIGYIVWKYNENHLALGVVDIRDRHCKFWIERNINHGLLRWLVGQHDHVDVLKGHIKESQYVSLSQYK